MLLPLFASQVCIALARFFWASQYHWMGWTLFYSNCYLGIPLFKQILVIISLCFCCLEQVKEWLVLCVSKVSKLARSFRYTWIILSCSENTTLNWLIIWLGTQQKFLMAFTCHLYLSTLSLCVICNNSNSDLNELYKKCKDMIIFILWVERFSLTLAWK